MNTDQNAIRILCYGDSNTRGFVPGSLGKSRYPANIRWAGILQDKLGSEYEVIEEGLDARTTAFDDPRPEFPLRNGSEMLKIILDTHKPLDWVVLMLGTTDTKELFNLSPEEITAGMEKNIKLINSFDYGLNTTTPKILLITPPIVNETTKFASQLFKGGNKKGKKLTKLYFSLAKKYSCHFLDTSTFLFVDNNEGVHLTESSHKKLGQKVCEIIRNIEIETVH